MRKLAACPSCSRHVRIEEPRCPFCAHALAGAFDHQPSAFSLVGRFSRAALLAIGASGAAAGATVACSSDDRQEPAPLPLPAYGQPPDDGNRAQPYGIAGQFTQDAGDAGDDSGKAIP